MMNPDLGFPAEIPWDSKSNFETSINLSVMWFWGSGSLLSTSDLQRAGQDLSDTQSNQKKVESSAKKSIKQIS